MVTPETFSALFVRWHGPFVAIANSYIHDKTAAEDIVSECFAKFWDRRECLEITGLPEAYLMTSVKNRCLNYLRDHAAKMRVSYAWQDDAYRAMMAEIEILEAQDTDLLFSNEVRRLFEEAMDSLPPLARDIFYSSRFEDLTYNEIAVKYSVSPRKVKREIQKVLDVMRTHLKDYLPLVTFLVGLYYTHHL